MPPWASPCIKYSESQRYKKCKNIKINTFGNIHFVRT